MSPCDWFLSLAVPYVGILIMIGIFIYVYLRARKRRTFILTTGKPLTDLRSLRWMDSWQVSIIGLGDLASEVKNGFMTRLKSSSPEGSIIDIEKIGYWGTDGRIEREQIVIKHRRAISFIHVFPYEDVLYVAWECHLNSASWNEEKITSGVDRVSGLNVVANRVVAGWHQLNEYDVGDSNYIAEWIHEAMKRELKLRMGEKEIDQEIDFTIQRESRGTAFEPFSEKNSEKTQKKPGY